MKLDARSAALLLPLLALPATAAEHGFVVHTADDSPPGSNAPRIETPQSDSAPRGPHSEPPEAVRRRELAVNLFLCANGLPGCDPSLLTPEQRERFLANRPPSQ